MSSSFSVFFFVEGSEHVAVWWQGVLDLLEFHHVRVDGVLGWDATHSGGELHVLGRLLLWLVSEGINGVIELLIHLAQKVIKITLRSSGHSHGTSSLDGSALWNFLPQSNSVLS